MQTLSRENELILNSAGEGIFGLDLQSKMNFCNPVGKFMLGYETHELIGYMFVLNLIENLQANYEDFVFAL